MNRTTTRPEPSAGNPNSGTKKKTAFIAAPTATAANSLRKVLDEIGFVSLTTFEADQPGKNIPEISTDCMRQSDIVVAVLGEGPMKPNVFFELGLAHGLGKRILIIAEEKAVPTARSLGDPYTLAKPDDADAVGFAVNLILTLPHHGIKLPEKSEKQTHPIDGLADELLAEVRSGQNSLTDRRLVNVIQRAIERSGVTVVSEPRFGDAYVDLAVWSDDLEPWVQNPLLIELKSDLMTETELKQTVERMVRSMQQSGVSNSLIIYKGSKPAIGDFVHFPNITFVSIEDFLESLRTSGFGDVLRELRNRNVHGTN